MEPFVHLHVHTEYSLLDGANKINRLVQAAVDDGHEALAITDHGNLFGALEFYKACKKAAIKPILGCEVYVAMDSRLKSHNKKNNPYTHLTLLARDFQGWQNLMELTSIAHLEGSGFRPRVDMEVLHQHASGITCLSGCMSGPVNRKLRDGDDAGALQVAGELQDLFGPEHFFLEVMRNGMSEQDKLTEGMVRLKPRVNAPLIATNDIHYLRHEDCNTQDALLCLHQNKQIADPDRWKMGTDTLFFRTREDMNRIFGDLPEALQNTLTVADQIDVEIEMGKLRLPHFQPPDQSSPDQYFRRLCEEGFNRFYPQATLEAKERLEYEMQVIMEMGFVSYFLITWDLIRHAREVGIPVGPGRGSAAGSIVAYVMEITKIDPLKYDLIFERFLNSSRISMPDIDIDFCKARREEIIQYVRQKYGDDNVCQIITFGKLKAKNALRDMARVSGIHLSEADKAAKKIPDGPGVSLANTLENEKELQEIADRSPENRAWFDLALNVEGLARNSGVHAAGVIIADEPLRDIIPLSKQGKDQNITTQWDMSICEEFGLLKMDFLGLRTLTILDDAIKMVEKKTGESICLDDLPLDDPKTYELLREADTEGVFQLESSGMRRLLIQLKPDSYEDIVAVLALFRPGPLGSGLHEIYARRKHGQEKISFPHPILEEILSETYGLLIYQEQIMRVAQKMSGFSLNDADTLRKAMGKKKKELMDPFEGPFMDGASANEIPKEVSEEIWQTMVKFAEYGFNKSHSTAYAMVTYQAAWMKAHHPLEFYASSLTHEAFDSDKLHILVEDARKHDSQVRPPCVNRSEATFLVEGNDGIRFGLSAIKGVGEGAAETLVHLREQQESSFFENYDEFLVVAVASNINKTTFEGLIKAGALDCFGAARVDLNDELESALAAAQARAKDRARGQAGLFDQEPPSSDGSTRIFDPNSDPEEAHHAPRELSKEERKRTLTMEKESLGMYLTRHPLDPYRAILPGISSWDSKNVGELPDRAKVALVGVASHMEIQGTRKDPTRKFARFKIEDLKGSTSALAWPSTYEDFGEHLVEDFIGIFHGQIDHSGETPTMLIDRVEPLGEPEDLKLEGSLEIRIDGQTTILPQAKEFLEKNPGPSHVRFHYKLKDGTEKVIRADNDFSVRLSGELIDDLVRLFGPGNVRVAPARKLVKKAEQPRWKTRQASSS